MNQFAALESAKITDRGYWPLVAPLLLVALILIHPVVYVGTDDRQYLAAAQCLDCLPTDHWQRRFLLTWPLALSRRVPWLPALVAAVACLVLLYRIVERWHGPRAALIASCCLVLTPIFSERAHRIGIDIIELAFILGSVALLQSRRGLWAGVCLGLAILCRPTVFAVAPMLCWWAWRIGALRAFLAGMLAPLFAEAAVYLVLTGDPLYPWKLSLQHTQIPSSVLKGVDTTQSPLFNTAFIQAWEPRMGIYAHWTIRGLVNLLAAPEIGFTLVLGFALAIGQRTATTRNMLVSAVIFFVILTYAFAIDPRPRMYLPLAVIASIFVGKAALELPRWIGLAVVAAITMAGVAGSIDRWDRGKRLGPCQGGQRAVDRIGQVCVFQPKPTRQVPNQLSSDSMAIDVSVSVSNVIVK